MIYNIYSPSAELKKIVKYFLVIDSFDGVDEMLFLPDGGNCIMFNRGVDGYMKTVNDNKLFHIPKKYSISDKRNKAKKIILNTDADEADKNIIFPIIFVELMPIGFYKLFNKNAYDLNDGFLEIDDEITEKYFSKLYTHESIEEELAYLNSNLNDLHLSHDHELIDMENILEAIINMYDYEVSIEILLKEFGRSRSTLERHFKKYIGLTPKNFIYISKFCNAVLSYIEEKCTFNELKYIYSDNSHLNVVFKKFLGVNPTMLLNEIENNNIKIYQIQNLNFLKKKKIN